MNSIELESAFFDFWYSAEVDKDAALAELLCLLMSPNACRTRCLLLNRLAAAAEGDPKLSRARKSAGGKQQWQKIIRAVGTFGPAAALEAGSVTLDELDALTWDQEALLKVHERLCEPLPLDDFEPVTSEEAKHRSIAAYEDTAAGPLDTSVDLTKLWHDNQLGRIRPHVERCIPFLLDHMGLDKSLASEASEYVLEKARQSFEQDEGGPSGSFRMAVALWLLEFGKDRGAKVLSDDAWGKIILRVAVDQCLDWIQAQPDYMVDFFRDNVVGRLGNVDELLEIQPDETLPNAPELKGFLDRLYEEVSGPERELHAVWS